MPAVSPSRREAPALQRVWTDAWNHLRAVLGAHGGRALTRDLLPGIAGLQIAASAAVVLATWGIATLLRRLAHRKIVQHARDEAAAASEAPPPSWLRLTLQEAGPPFLLSVWICGLYGALWLLSFRLPAGAQQVQAALNWLAGAALSAALFWFLYRMINVVEAELKHWAGRLRRKWADVLAAVVARALRLIAPLVAILLILPTLKLSAAGHEAARQIASLLLIAGVGFSLCKMAATAEKAVISEYRTDLADNLAMRKIQTQVRMLAKIAVVVIAVITVAAMLMVFDSVRRLGTSLLASAGIVGIVVGFAAQRTLGTLIAGIQIAFTQPIRLDDVVIVEGEWGRIEEITMTYVVVAIWDLRRMVLPITYFIEKPFQNWTRVGAALLGSVFLYTDYTVPVGALRTELDRILEQSKLWDGKVKVVQVTDAKERTIEIRVLVSAADSSQQWALRCEVREKMVDFLQRNYPSALPRTRAEWRALPDPGLGDGARPPANPDGAADSPRSTS
ncbi:MAG: mechanosensitive ion channel family protein [Opitutaceae bacterium]